RHDGRQCRNMPIMGRHFLFLSKNQVSQVRKNPISALGPEPCYLQPLALPECCLLLPLLFPVRGSRNPCQISSGSIWAIRYTANCLNLEGLPVESSCIQEN